MRVVRFLAIMVALAACSSGTDSPPTVAGDWRGTATDGALTYTYNITLQQSGQTLTGSGTVDISNTTGGPFPLANFTGTYVAPTVTLVFTGGTFTGTHSGASIAGTITDGQDAIPLTLTRR